MSKKIKVRTQRPWIGYPGSVLQQNYAEDVTHGYLLWDIEDRNNFDVKFQELPNPKPFVTIDWQGSVDQTLVEASKHPRGGRFRIKNNDVLTQKEVMQLTSRLHQDMKAIEVTFKNEHQVNRNVINAGSVMIAKEDLRSVEILMKLLKEYHREGNIDDCEWDAVQEQVATYLQKVLDSDDVVRNTKWMLKYLKFDNTFTYGSENVINFENLQGIVGIFGPNKSGKSSIVGTIMYALFNATDRGSIKNLSVVNIRQPYCYSNAIVDVNGTNYVIERQTTKYESKKGIVHAGTALNVLKIDENGNTIDLNGLDRNDTEKVVRNLIGNAEDCLLTSVAAQNDVNLFINQGTSQRRKILSRFLDLDIFDRMYELAKNDVNLSKGALKNFPDRDWAAIARVFDKQFALHADDIKEKDNLLHDANQRLHELRAQLAAFKDFSPVTKTQLEDQQRRVKALEDKLHATHDALQATRKNLDSMTNKVNSIELVCEEHDLIDLKRRLEACRTLESTFESLKHAHTQDSTMLKQQERSLKILDDVPCGDSFPTCKFIGDAFKNKGKIDQQRERTQKALDKLQKAEVALNDLKKEGLADKVSKVEQLLDAASKLRISMSNKTVELVKLENVAADLASDVEIARQRLLDLSEALKNEENVEVISLRNSLDETQKLVKTLDVDRLRLASEVGRLQSDQAKMQVDRAQRQELLQVMKAHDLIAQAFSRKGIPSLIVASQLPLINAEISKILNGIVNFNIELEQDDDSDSMEVYIDDEDGKRIIEVASGMEKTIASIAIRVALTNVSSLPKPDMFIIDESFGPLDPPSIEACNRLLVSLKRYFRCLIVISHVDGIKDVADCIIEITKVGNDAMVVYNDSWPKDRTLKIG